MSTARPGLRELTGHKRRVLGMFRLKACPRCRGDMVLDRDCWGWYEQCIQCGYLFDVPNVTEAKRHQAQEKNHEQE